MSEQTLNAMPTKPPDTIEEFYGGLAQGQATSAGTPDFTPTQPPPIPDLPTAQATPSGTVIGSEAPPAPATPTVVPKPEPSSDNLLDEALKGQIDPELLQVLRNQAKGNVTLGEVFALAGLAAANPELAATTIRSRDAGTANARSVLANLQQQATLFKKAQLQAGTQADAQNELGKRALITQHGQMVRAAMEDIGGQEAPPLPDDLSDSAAVNKWLNQVQPTRQKLAKQKAQAAAFNQVEDNVALLAKNGAWPTDPAQGAELYKRKLMLATGASEEEASKAAFGSPALANASAIQKRYQELRNQRETAYTKMLDAKTRNLDALSQKVGKDLRNGGLNSLKSAWGGINALRGELTASVQGLAMAQSQRQRYIMAVQNGQITEQDADEQIAMADRMIMDFTSTMTRAQGALKDAEDLMAPYVAKLNFVSTVPMLMDKAVKQTLESDLILYQNPQAVLASIGLPGTNPVKDAFWTRLMAQIRLTYGDGVSLLDVRDALEQQMLSMANPQAAAQPGMEAKAAEILSPNQEHQYWDAGGKAAEEQRKKRPPAPAKGEEGRKPYETGTWDSIKYKALGVLSPSELSNPPEPSAEGEIP